ncbi:motility-associated protein [Thiomicrospira sp. WB1]|uniref:motility-associated protein n=1 Tax=Thiomicrospira sp. WB1 TaxID=1685380 RepID=UPI000749C85A|nr:motility-associated protein [Thiomicrospira sp. WB1]KUJ72604.1 biopolymer transporter ExbB [Thiomicrospira sp. WB1]
MFAKPFAILVILGSLFGGFMMAGGELIALWHPAELVVILGLGLGTFLGATPVYVWKRTMVYTGRFFSGGRIKQRLYLETLDLLDDLSRLARSEGLLALENHIAEPDSSSIFAKYPTVLKHRDLRRFIIDNFNYLLLNPPQSLNFEEFLHDQIDDLIESMSEVPRATGKLTALMPGYGIIAAVMGVILTMNLLGGDMDVAKIGTSIGAALVGTLTGIFFAFAVFAPFTHSIEIMIRQDRALFEMTASFFVAFAHGVSPSMAMEVARQRVPPEFALPRND